MLKAKRRRSKLSMTSLIDVIFLLLLFFMLTSTFTKYAEVELLSAPEGAGAPQDSAQSKPIFLRAGADDLSVNAREVGLDALAQAVAELRSEETGQRVLLSLKPETDAQRLTDVLLVLRTIPGLSLSVLGAAS